MNSVLICDDHALVREAIAGTVIGNWPGVEIAEAGSFPDAWAAAARGFELCICDLLMPGAEAQSGIVQLKQVAPDMPILIITGQRDDALMLQLLQHGVNGFVEKDKGSKVIIAAIHLILAGERHVPPRVLELNATPAQATASTIRLTDQQRRVIALVAEGKSNKAIASEMGVAPSTIKSHLEQAMRATSATSRFEAVNRARTAGVI